MGCDSRNLVIGRTWVGAEVNNVLGKRVDEFDIREVCTAVVDHRNRELAAQTGEQVDAVAFVRGLRHAVIALARTTTAAAATAVRSVKRLVFGKGSGVFTSRGVAELIGKGEGASSDR